MRMVALPDGTPVAALGQGTWRMGEQPALRAREVASLQDGVARGMTLIDTAEMYGDGGAEEVVGEAIAGCRDAVTLVSKVHPRHASRTGVVAACERSLRRLRTDRIDLYLLHWRSAEPLAETVAGFSALLDAGKIRHWGVSNFDTADMDEVFALPHGAHCATNQVLYNLDARGMEFDLGPWCGQRRVPVMAYSPVGQGGRLLGNGGLRRVAERHGATPAQIAIAWTLRDPWVVSIPKATDPAHVAENAAAAEIGLVPADLAELDAAFPPPRRKQKLGML